jgi:hypothetical protein
MQSSNKQSEKTLNEAEAPNLKNDPRVNFKNHPQLMRLV